MESSLGVLDALPALVWTALPDGTIDFVNRHWTEYTGLDTRAAQGSGWLVAIDPDDLPRLLERWRSIRASGRSGEMEARIRRFDGGYRAFLMRASPMRDDAGRIVKWCGVATDVDDLRRAEEALRRRQLDFQLIVDSIPIPVAVTTPTGEVEGLNKPTLDYFGKTFEELKGWKTCGVVHPDDLEQTIAAQVEAHRKQSPYVVESRHLRADGAYRWHLVHGLPLRDPQGKVLRWLHLLIDIDDRKRAEEALRESARYSRLIVDSVPGLLSTMTADGKVEFCNAQILQYFGKSIEELRDWATNDTIYPDDLARDVEEFTRGIASGQPYQIEIRGRRSDGVYRWLECRAAPLRDSSGRIVRWFNLLVDIDERKRAEEAWRVSEINLSSVVDGVPGLVAVLAPDGTNEFVNQQLLKYCGREDKEFKDWDADGLVHEDDVPVVSAIFSKSIGAGVPYECDMRLKRFDGVYRWFSSRGIPVRSDSGRITRWYVLLTDVEDRKLAEDKLRQSQAFLADAQRLSRTGSFSWRVATGELTWSEEMYRIYALDPATPVTLEQVRTRIHPDNLTMLRDLVDRARQNAGEFDHETRLLMPDQSVKYLHVVAHGYRTHDGDLEVRGAVQDVTEKRLAEEALGKARSELAHVTRVTSLGALTASIAHEVRQPLSGIITNAGTCLRMLAANPPNFEGARETARRTIRDGNRAADVIDRLRALFSKRSLTIEPVDLNETAREVIALARADLLRSRVVPHTELAEGLPAVAGDRVQLQQVIMNLVRNAADAMSGVDDRARRLVIRTEPDANEHVRLTVEDNGIGLEPQATERLFDAFYTTKSEGMGIGLSISRSIIESHYGRIWARANVGPGARFAFSLPQYSEDAGSEIAPGPEAVNTRANGDRR